MTSPGERPPLSRDDLVRGLLLAADRAAADEDFERERAIRGALALVADVANSERSNELQGKMLAHKSRIDNLRHVVAILLIFALFAVIIAGIVAHVSGEGVAQLAAPISGLAGIAIGWLFGGRDQPSIAPDPLPVAPLSPPGRMSVSIGGSNFGPIGR